MPEKASFDYIDNDPLVSVTLINPASKKKVKAFAYLDTGSDTVVIPRASKEEKSLLELA